MRLGPPSYDEAIIERCERGRETLVLIRLPGSPALDSPADLDPYAFWVFPRFLNCP